MTRQHLAKDCQTVHLCANCQGVGRFDVTDLAFIEVNESDLILKEIAPGWAVEEVQALTEPRLIVAEDLKEIEL